MQSPKKTSKTKIDLTKSFDVSLQSDSLQPGYKYPGKQHIKKKIPNPFGFLALARAAFDLPEQLLLHRYEGCVLTKGHGRPRAFTAGTFSSAQAKQRWQNGSTSLRSLCCSVPHGRNANQPLKGDVAFQQRPIKMQNGNRYAPTKMSRTCASSGS